MSLPAQQLATIPAETSRVAKAAFPKGTFCLKLRDELGSIYQDEQFADLFSKEGQPALAPGRLALISVLQFVEGLSDRQAAQMVRARLDWKYLLGLELTDSGFDYSVLCEFRARLINGQAELRLLDHLLAQIQERGWLKASVKQRTDATQVLGVVRLLNRLEMLGETLRAALNALAVAAPEWLVAQIPEEWYTCYGRRIEDYRLPDKDSERESWGLAAGVAGFSLWQALSHDQDLDWLVQLPALQTLRQVWLEQFWLDDGQVCLRPQNSTPPPGQRIHSPYEVEARYASKREIHWLGYKVHLTETCEQDSPNLITQVQTSLATEPDVKATAPIQENLAQRQLLPAQHIVDGGYVSAAEILDSQLKRGVALCGPLRLDASWQGRAGVGFAVGQFQLDWAKQQAVCPCGQLSSKWETKTNAKGQALVQVSFAKTTCFSCQSQADCTKMKHTGRLLQLRPQAEHAAIEAQRQVQATPEFKELSNLRAGIEGTLSQAVRGFELRQSRYRGLAKTHLQHILTAVGLNLTRLYAWWEGVPRAKTRVSHLAALKPAA